MFQTVIEATLRDSIGPRASFFLTRNAAEVLDFDEVEVSYLLKILRQHVECCEIKSSLSDLLQEKLGRIIANCPASKRFTLRTSTLDNRRQQSICGTLRLLIISSSWSFGKLVLYLDIWPRLRPRLVTDQGARRCGCKITGQVNSHNARQSVLSLQARQWPLWGGNVRPRCRQHLSPLYQLRHICGPKGHLRQPSDKLRKRDQRHDQYNLNGNKRYRSAIDIG